VDATETTSEARSPSESRSTSQKLRPPICSNVGLPQFPPEVRLDADAIDVRVDFVVRSDGETADVHAEWVDPESAGPLVLLESAASAVNAWSCAPAWRMAREDEPPGLVTADYRTWIVFRFRTVDSNVEVAATPE
jgi:hypothetical protein